MLFVLLIATVIVVALFGLNEWILNLPHQAERDSAHGMGPWSADEGDA